MREIQDMVDRFEIESLRTEFTDAVMMRDYDRLVTLFTDDGAVRMPHIRTDVVGRSEIRTAAEGARSLWSHFEQLAHPGAISVQGDTASGRAYLVEFGQLANGGSHRNCGVYHDRYRRTADGWKFAERVYEVRYLDTTPLSGGPYSP